MMERNQRVFETSEKQRWPTVVFMGGGYSKPIEHTVDAFVDLFTQAAAAQMRITRHC
jgi:adenosine deaminase